MNYCLFLATLAFSLFGMRKAKIIYVDNIGQFGKYVESSRKLLSDSQYGVFLHGYLTYDEIQRFPSNFPDVQHYQLVNGVFNAIYINPAKISTDFAYSESSFQDVQNIISVVPSQGTTEDVIPTNEQSSKKSLFNSPITHSNPYSKVDFHDFNHFKVGTSIDIGEILLMLYSNLSSDFFFVLEEDYSRKNEAMQYLELNEVCSVFYDIINDNEDNETDIAAKISNHFKKYYENSAQKIFEIRLSQFYNIRYFSSDKIKPYFDSLFEKIEGSSNQNLSKCPYFNSKIVLDSSFSEDFSSMLEKFHTSENAIIMLLLSDFLLKNYSLYFNRPIAAKCLKDAVELCNYQLENFNKNILGMEQKTSEQNEKVKRSFVIFVRLLVEVFLRFMNLKNFFNISQVPVGTLAVMLEIYYDAARKFSYDDFSRFYLDGYTEDIKCAELNIPLTLSDPTKHPVFPYYLLVRNVLGEIKNTFIDALENEIKSRKEESEKQSEME